MNPIWVGSPTDVRCGQEALEALAKTNDACYAKSGNEVLMVPEERWRAAQHFEKTTWMDICPHAQSDRNEEHKANFNGYDTLPNDLGHILEIGCGPFTQMRTICMAGHRAKSITLLDPLLDTYLKHPNCTYKNTIATFLSMRAEELDDALRFDTVICINVLEHVQDAAAVLNKLFNALNPDGWLVFQERSWNIDLTKLYDVGHPIRVSEATVAAFIACFRPIYYKTIEGDCYIDHYAIVRRP